MEFQYSIFFIPPFICLVTGISLAILSLVKGKLKKENILFSMVCFWVSAMLAPAFLSHFFFTDMNIIMRVERTVHFFYMFILPITVIFYHNILGINRRWLEYTLIAISIILAGFTRTEWYLTGELYTYHWGQIAKGGIAFQVFGAIGIICMIYAITICIIKLRTEKNPINRSKIKYILFSINAMMILTLTNFPAMNGIDSYPYGNFMFIPVIIMAYGVLRYRLFDIRSIIHLTLIWVVTSSLIIIPNVVLFILLKEHLQTGKYINIFFILAVWLAVNMLYYRWIQPLINRLFNRNKMNLNKAGAVFIENISMLKSLDGVLDQFKSTLTETLHLKSVDIFLNHKENPFGFSNKSGITIEISKDILEWFLQSNHLVDIDMVNSNPSYKPVREILLKLFDRIKYSVMLPLIQNEQMIGLLLLGEKITLKPFSRIEIRFINNIRSAATISLMNSIMYQDISDMKYILEEKVQERTKELKIKNDQMLFELQVAKKVQMTIIPEDLPHTEQIRIAAKMLPLMEVSGDFYDVVYVNENSIAIAIIDVSGHGISAALLTSMIKSEIATQLEKHAKTSEICTGLNTALYPTLVETGFYFTMFICLVDLKKLTLEFTNCGHTEPFLLKEDKKFTKLNTEGMFIGLSYDTKYGSSTIQLMRGDRVFLYTDGITEARDAVGDEMGETRFLKAITATASLPIKEQIYSIMTTVDKFRDKTALSKKDDITLLAFEVGAPVLK